MPAQLLVRHRPATLGHEDPALARLRHIEIAVQVRCDVGMDLTTLADAVAGQTPCAAEQLRVVIDNLKDVVFQTDAAGRWTFLNRAWEEITGFPVAESLGKPFLDYVHPEDRELNQQRFQPLIERQKQFCRHEVRYVTNSGGLRWIEVHARLTLDASGAILGTSGTLSDITEQRLAEDELRRAHLRLDVALASNPAVLFSGRPEPPYETTFVSDNVRAVLGYEPRQFMDSPGFWFEQLHPADYDVLRDAIEQMERTGKASYRYRMRHRNGTYRRVRSITRMVRDNNGAPLEVCGCMVDETDARETEAALDRYAGILEAVNFAAQTFLTAGSWQSALPDVLGHLGRAAQASRVYVFETRNEPGREPAAVLCGDWAAPGIAVPGDTAEFASVPYVKLGMGAWVEALTAGQVVQARVDHLAEPARSFLERYEIQSLMLVPILTGNRLWGAIGIDDRWIARKWSSAEASALTAAAGILGATINRESTGAALRCNEALLRTVAEASPLAFYVVEQSTGRVLYCNDRFLEIWGIGHLRASLRQDTLTHRDVVAVCASQVADEAAYIAIASSLHDPANTAVMEDRIELKDGRTLRRFSTPIRDGADRAFGRLCLLEDITQQRRAAQALLDAHGELEQLVNRRTLELQSANALLRVEIADRQKAEKALAQRETHFRALIDNTLDVIFVVSAGGIIRYISPSVARTLGFDPGELLGTPAFGIVHPADVPRAEERFRLGLDIPGTHVPVELRVRHKNGSWKTVEAVGNNQLQDVAVQGIIITLRDLTERRRLEEQFRQAQKMEAIGRLAGGVAHDFNNLLTVIRGYSGLIAKRMNESDVNFRHVGQIAGAADRAAALVQQLLAFSRKQIIEPRVLDIATAVTDLERMLRRLIGEDIELSIATTGQPVYVKIDPTQFEQIVMNLSVNARDAMPEGGHLRIETSIHGRNSEPSCSGCKVNDGSYAMLLVEDTGSGVSEEIRPFIFEPFFTTKEVGKGTGLGLSMVYGAVEQASGHICVENRRGGGATFRICLPLVDSPEEAGCQENASASPCGGTETILVAEDEEQVRRMIGEALREAGYRVIEATDGRDALEQLAGNPGTIHLLVTDVVMPRMNGPVLAAEFSAARPDARVLFISGHPRKELGPGCTFLRKPFTPDELAREVRAVLDAPH